jgi:putative transposase
MAERGVCLTYEAVRYWCRKFGQQYASQLRSRHARPGDKWRLDEVLLRINGLAFPYDAVDLDSCDLPLTIP